MDTAIQRSQVTAIERSTSQTEYQTQRQHDASGPTQRLDPEQQARTELEQAAERLGVRVLIPLALCVLPSFIVLGALPVLISMLRDVGG